MDMWMSESAGLESKAQLKAIRLHRFNALIGETDLTFMQSYAYTAEEKQLADSLWSQADEDYESRKVNLKDALNLLPAAKKTEYFKDIGVTEETPDNYLSVSPFVI